MSKLVLYRGQTYSGPLPLGMNLTGATVYFTAKKNFDDDVTDTSSNTVIRKDITTHDNATAGITRLILTSTDTDIKPGDYKCDVHVKIGSAVYPYVPGVLTIKPSVTLRS